MSAMKAYEEIYGDDPDRGHMDALRELFLPNGDMGARKRRRRRSAARA
jgi:hypothetical protein